MALLIRNMVKEDILRVGEILYEGFTAMASKHGYASNVESAEEGKRLAWALFHHGPCERLVAVSDGRIVGLTCLNIRGDIAGLGPTVVDPSYQDKAIARELVENVLKKVKDSQSVRTFTEAYNTGIYSLAYFTLDFTPVADLLDLHRSGRVTTLPDRPDDIVQIEARDIDDVLVYDNPRSKSDRRPDFRFYTHWGKVLVYRSGSETRGFLACLPNPRWVQLGPMVAEGEDEAVRLFQHALMLFEGSSFRSRIMVRDRGLAKALKKLGFRIYCVNNLWVQGMWRPSRYVEAFGMFPEAI
jgi:GNAT superfamily N-acetyltransferase